MNKTKKRRYLSFISRLNIKSAIRLLTVLMLIGSINILMGQSINCETEDMMSMPHPDMSIQRTQKCVRLKFHDFTGSPYKSDVYWNDLLLAVNTYFSSGEIKWVFEDNCVHRADLAPMSPSWVARNRLTSPDPNDVDLVIWDPDTELEADDNSVNVFFSGGSDYMKLAGDGHPFVNISTDEPTIELLAHELGHTLSLLHTHGDINLGLLPLDEREHKARSGVNKNCDGVEIGDELCDTDADPFAMDLDNVPGADGHIHVINCQQSTDLIPSIKDAANDNVTPWNIPLTNLMSYYDDCKYELTDGQYARMHDYLEMPDASHLVVSTCPVDLPTCNDIIIAGTVTWSNQTVELCPNQRIFISVNSRLILDNCILTKKVTTPAVGCLDLDIWDGIYFEPGYCDPPGPMPCPHLGGALTTLNGTIIEYSKNGVVAEDKFLSIDMTNTIMRKNGKAFTAINSFNPGANPLGASDIGRIDLLNTTILVDDENNTNVPIKDVQINLVGRPLTMYNCTLKVVNPNVQQGNAIITVGSSLSILGESRIENFDQAIYKDIDNPFDLDGGTGGLWIQDSKILNCETAIMNKCYLVHVEHNFIRGDVISEGLGFGRWYRNNFGTSNPNEDGRFHLINPQLSNMIENNKFEQDVVRFKEDNIESIALCNVWDFPIDRDFDYIIVENGAIMPPAWGSFNDDESIASGNSHDVDDDVTMSKWNDDPIKNYEYQCMDCDLYYFSYNGVFESGDADEKHPDCNHDFPNLNGGGGGDGGNNGNYDGGGLDSLWNDYQVMINDLNNDLVGADTPTMTGINEHLNWLSAQQNNIVGIALFQLDANATTTWVNLWMNRAPIKVAQRSQIIELMVDDQLSTLSSLLSGITTNSQDDTDDLSNLTAAITSMINWDNSGLDIYHLSFDNISSLKAIAEMSYGDYTAVLRGFLNAYYGIRIVSPDTPINLNAKPQSDEVIVKDDGMAIIPNPNSGCFRLKGAKRDHELLIQIFDLSGKLQKEKMAYSNQDICTLSLQPSIYILNYRNMVTGKAGSLKLIID